MRISDWSSDVCYSDLVLMFRLPVLAAVAATVVSVATPVIAQAQEIPAPTVMVIDTNRIMTEAKAMKNIRDQIERIRGAFQNEIKKEEDELRAADQDMAGQRQLLSPEAFNQRRQELQQRAAALPVRSEEHP